MKWMYICGTPGCLKFKECYTETIYLKYMRTQFTIFLILIFILGLVPVNFSSAADLATRLKGKILLQVESNGEAWYVNPANEKRYYMGRPDDAFQLMRSLGIGIINSDLWKIPVAEANFGGTDSDSDGLSDRIEDAFATDKNKTDTDGDGYSDRAEILNGYSPTQGGAAKLPINTGFANSKKGNIYLQIQAHGEAWYVNPDNSKRYFLGRPTDAFNVMRSLGLGITNSNLNQIQKQQSVGDNEKWIYDICEAVLKGPYGLKEIQGLITKTLKTADPSRRDMWLALLVRKKEALPVLIERLKTGSDNEKYNILMLIQGELRWPEIVPTILQVLNDKNNSTRVRSRAATASALFQQKQAIPAIRDLLQTAQDAQARQLAAIALGVLRDTESKPFIEAMLNDQSSYVRAYAAEALGMLGFDTGETVALELSRDESFGVRSGAAEALAYIRTPKALARLKEMAESDPSSAVKSESYIYLQAAEIIGLTKKAALQKLDELIAPTNPNQPGWAFSYLINNFSFEETQPLLSKLAVEPGRLQDSARRALLPYLDFDISQISIPQDIKDRRQAENNDEKIWNENSFNDSIWYISTYDTCKKISDYATSGKGTKDECLKAKLYPEQEIKDWKDFKSKKSKACAEFVDYNYNRDVQYIECMAEEKDDLSLCNFDLLTDEQKKLCISQAAKDISSCPQYDEDEPDGWRFYNLCIYNIALRNKDISLCNKMRDNESYKTQCHDDIIR